MKTRLAVGFAVAIAFSAAACTGSGGPSSTPPPSTQPVPLITSPEEAGARVIASDQRFTGIARQDPDLIGQGSWWQAEARDGGYRVQIQIGWGDCPAGCIDRHDWIIQVGTDGTMTLLEETGPPLPGA